MGQITQEKLQRALDTVEMLIEETRRQIEYYEDRNNDHTARDLKQRLQKHLIEKEQMLRHKKNLE